MQYTYDQGRYGNNWLPFAANILIKNKLFVYACYICLWSFPTESCVTFQKVVKSFEVSYAALCNGAFCQHNSISH